MYNTHAKCQCVLTYYYCFELNDTLLVYCVVIVTLGLRKPPNFAFPACLRCCTISHKAAVLKTGAQADGL